MSARSRTYVIVSLGVIVAAGVIAFAATTVTARLDTTHVRPLTLPRAATPSPSLLPLSDIGRSFLPDVVTVEADRSNEEALGTGWLFDSKGDFVTNAHVVAGQLAVRITDRLARTHVAVVIGVDDAEDIAVLRSSDGFAGTPLPVDHSALTSTDISAVALASSRATGHGDMTAVTITALDQQVPLVSAEPYPGFPSVYDDMLGLIGPRIYEGNSGGPVIDQAGQVVGIVTLANSQGLNAFAIPMSRVVAELERFAGR